MNKDKFNEEIKKYVGLIQIIGEPSEKILNYSGFLIRRNIVLTSCHCVTPIKKNKVHCEIAPSDVIFKVKGVTKNVKEIYRFLNYQSLNENIYNLNNIYPRLTDELIKIRDKVKHNLDFAVLIIDDVDDFDENFLSIYEGNDWKNSEYFLYGFKDNNLEKFKLEDYLDEGKGKEGMCSFSSLKCESLRGGVIFIKLKENYYLHSMKTSSFKPNEKKESAIRLSKFLREIGFRTKGNKTI